MKNKLMERKFFNRTIRQHVGTEMLCVSDLFQAYEEIRKEKGWSKKHLHHFFEKKNTSNNEFIVELVREANLVNHDISGFMNIVEKQGLVKALKKYDLYLMKGKGETRKTFCNPYIFTAIAMWMNPLFKAKVTVWITDQLIVDRIAAGERYKILSRSIDKFILPNLKSDNAKKFIFSNFAKLVNKKIFGYHKKDTLRQIATKEELTLLTRMQDRLSAVIEVGYISSYQEAKDYIENLDLDTM